jgi:hypothetical protein
MTQYPTRFPSKDDYLKAVQDPRSFISKELRRAQFVPHPIWRIPAPAAGGSAVVFKAVLDGQEKGLRFPTRPPTSTKERYDALYEHFARTSLDQIVAMPLWVNNAIRVDGRTWPMVRMEWIDGRALHYYVEQLVDARNTTALGVLAARWLDLVRELQAARFAHGDLQHGNVLIDEHGALHLVDFDCSWIERLAEQSPPTETGHRNYQPANRPWGRWMDTFSGLVVYLSLITLSRNPGPWHALNTGDNLLFRREDFQPPFQTAVWTHLARIRDPELDQLTARLQQCCAPGWTADRGLSELLVSRQQSWWEIVSSAPMPTAAGPSSPARPAPQPRTAKAPPTAWWQHLQTNQPDTPPPENTSTGRRMTVSVLLATIVIIFLIVAIG